MLLTIMKLSDIKKYYSENGGTPCNLLDFDFDSFMGPSSV